MNNAKPLEGKRVLVTRAKAQAERFARHIRNLGGSPVVIPLIKIARPNDVTLLVKAIHKLEAYDWLVFTSQNGVETFFSIVREENIPSEWIEKRKIAVVGEKTREPVNRYGYDARVIPSGSYTAESLSAELLKHVKPGERVLFPRGNLARDVLRESLRKHDIHVHDIVAYETRINEDAQTDLIAEVIDKKVDVIAFTSPSTVHHFVTLLDNEDWQASIQDTCLAAIGPITEQAMLKYGLLPNVVAKLNTTEGLLQDVVHYLKNGEE